MTCLGPPLVASTRKPFVCILSILSYMHVIYENILQYRVSHRPENMRENMLENVRGRNLSVGHPDFFEPLPLLAPPNSPHSWLAPLTPRLGGRCPPNPSARRGQHRAPTAHLRPKSRFCRLRAGPGNAATPPDGGRSGLPTPAQGHPRPAWAVWSHARPAWFTKLDLRRARPGISGPGGGPNPHFATIS